MNHLTLLGAAAIAVSALATPAMAQTMRDNQVRCQSNANCESWRGSNASTERSYDRRVSYRQTRERDDWNRTRTGFWPADVAGNVAGAAVGAAGAIATAPFRAWDNSYAYDNSYPYDGGNRGWDSRSYAQRNGFVCTPGTYFRGEDGRPHLCQ